MEMNPSQIVHMDLDAFFVSVELLKNPELKGKPVIVGGSSGRGVVTSCSYEARRFGVRSAMPGRVARQLCPEAIFVRGSMEDYGRYSKMVTEILRSRAPHVEKASIDEHYLDLTGMEKYHHTMQFARELRQLVIRETGLPISFGLSVSKMIAKMATNACKPNGELEVKPDDVRAFLDPLLVSKIPGLGKTASAKLNAIGITRIADLMERPVEDLVRLLGKYGTSLFYRIRGIETSEFQPTRERKSIGTQSTFHSNSVDTQAIMSLITSMVSKLSFYLRSEGKLTACVTVTIRYSDFDTHTHQTSISYTSLDANLLQAARDLFNRNYNGKRTIRLVGVRFSDLINGSEQLSLYGASENQYKLSHALDNIRRKFGERSITPAAGLDARI